MKLVLKIAAPLLLIGAFALGQGTTLQGPVQMKPPAKGSPTFQQDMVAATMEFPCVTLAQQEPTISGPVYRMCGQNNQITVDFGSGYVSMQGLSGPQGPSGPPGPSGADGATGPQGVPGPAIMADYALVVRGARSSATVASYLCRPTLHLAEPSTCTLLLRYPESSVSWTMPAALTELFTSRVRVQSDLSNLSRVRIYAEIGSQHGPSGSTFFCQYSLDGGLTWNTLTAPVDVSATGSRVSAWQSIPVGAVGDVTVRAVSENGNGSKIDIEGVHLQAK